MNLENFSRIEKDAKSFTGNPTSLYSHCNICGRELTNPISMSRGIGPICFAKENMQFMINLTAILDQGPENNGEDQYPTLADYEKYIKQWECRNCLSSLKGETIEHYKHENGYPLHYFHEKQWLYLKCRKCGTCWSLWKLGVPADITNGIVCNKPMTEQDKTEERGKWLAEKNKNPDCFGTPKVKEIHRCGLCDFYLDCLKEERIRRNQKH